MTSTLSAPAAMRPCGDDEAVDEAGAGGVEVERAAAQPELVLHRGAVAGHGLVGRGGGQHQQVDSRRVDARGISSACAAGLDREAGGGAADAALAGCRCAR